MMRTVGDQLSAYALLPRLRDRHVSLYCVATGAGAGIQQALWNVPGASAFLRGSDFPYAPEVSAEFAGLTPAHYCSQDFAFDLACAAYRRAIDLKEPTLEPVGLACTASVASLTEHRGDHRAHIVCMTEHRIVGQSILLDKGKDRRLMDGRIVDSAALCVLTSALGLGEVEEPLESLEAAARRRFFEHPVFANGARWPVRDMDPSAPLFPGAFDPPHRGHEAIADAVNMRWEGIRARPNTTEAIFTICADPPHKEPLSIQEMLRRAKTLKHRTVLFTENDPFYIDKARAHPGTPLVIGADALLRMLDPKWGIDIAAMWAEFEKLGTRFLVFGREIEGTFVSASDAIVRVPSNRGLFCSVEGRWDLSSTALRHPAPGEGCTRSDGADPTHSGALVLPGT